jgi:putative endopeptidase
MNVKSLLVVVSMCLSLAGCSRAPENEAASSARKPLAAPTAAIGPWGFDVAGMDTTVKPGDDFYKYANGKWLATNKIPPDLPGWGTFTRLAVETEAQVHDIVESVPADAANGTAEQKVHDFYRSFLDVDAINKVGMAPAVPGLEAIAAAKTHADIATLMGRPDLGLDTPVNVGVSVDEKNPDRYIVGIGQGGLSLPDRDYYLKKDPQLVEIRQKYLAHIGRMLALAKEDNSDSQAKVVLDVETKIAQKQWPVEKRRERDLTYNLRTRAQLDTLAKNYPWQALLAAGNLQEQKEFVVAELDAVQSLAAQFTSIPVEQWRSYLKYHYLVTHAAVLPTAFDDEQFDFYSRTLNGQQQQRDRWKRAVRSLNSSVAEVVGQLYVKKHFPADSKSQMLALVENLRKAYAQRIRGLSWMSEATKEEALNKLRTFHPKIGYPDKWRDYSGLEIRPGDAFGNMIRARVFNWNYDVNRLGRPTDRDEWFLPPHTVNAYYNPTFNEIVFPAAILQPPYFDPHADPAVNYGGIGGIIGHEMGHGFDDQGAKSDEKGVLRDWWQPNDERAFKKVVDALVTQYSGYEALPGLKLNGRLTAGENIGDLGGLTVAYQAYHMSLNDVAPATMGGFTGDQRFFLAWAQCWRDLQRDQNLRNQVMSNPHSPAVFRVQGVVRNMDEWYKAFDVQPADKLFLPPEQRVHIW